jgi:hypothetical protein
VKHESKSLIDLCTVAIGRFSGELCRSDAGGPYRGGLQPYPEGRSTLAVAGVAGTILRRAAWNPPEHLRSLRLDQPWGRSLVKMRPSSTWQQAAHQRMSAAHSSRRPGNYCLDTSDVGSMPASLGVDLAESRQEDAGQMTVDCRVEDQSPPPQFRCSPEHRRLS